MIFLTFFIGLVGDFQHYILYLKCRKLAADQNLPQIGRNLANLLALLNLTLAKDLNTFKVFKNCYREEKQ